MAFLTRLPCLALSLLLSCLAGCQDLASPLQAADGGLLASQYIHGHQIVVGYVSGQRTPSASLPMRVDERYPLLGMELVEPAGGADFGSLLQALRHDPDVAFADPDGSWQMMESNPVTGQMLAEPPVVDPGTVTGGPNPVYKALNIDPSDPAPDGQCAWSLDLGPNHQMAMGAAATVSVLDTGWDPAAFPKANAVAQSFNGPDLDHSGHGTMVASVVSGPDGYGIAPAAPLIVTKILDKDGNGRISTTVRAFEWTLAQHPAVIVMAICAPKLVEIERMIAAADHAGILVVASAGNSARLGNPDLYPAGFAGQYPDVVAVGGWNWFMTADKPYVSLVAPAAAVPALSPTYPYVWNINVNGGKRSVSVTNTSMACAIVGGVASLMQDAYYQQHAKLLPAAQVVKILQQTAQPQPNVAPGLQGAGLVDPVKALEAVAQLP